MRLRAGRLVLTSRDLEIPLVGVFAQGLGLGVPLVAPEVSVGSGKTFGEGLALEPMRMFALRELLHAARSGKARMRLPVVPTVIEKGPLTIEIPGQTIAVIDLVVEGDGRIDRSRTHGTLEPPIRLPLGLSFHGLYLDDVGRVRCEITNFPDLNFSRLALGGLRIPASLDDVIELLFGDPKVDATTTTKPPSVDVKALEVEARQVRLKEIPIVLGEHSRVTTGPNTLLSIDYAPDLLEVRGEAQIVDTKLNGPGFAVDGLRGQARAGWELRPKGGMSLALDGASAGISDARLSLADGTELRLGPSEISGTDLRWSRSEAGDTWSVIIPSLVAKVEGGVVAAVVGKTPMPIYIDPVEIRGSVSWQGSVLEVDVALPDLHLRTGAFDLDLGGAHFRVNSAEVSVRGRLRIEGDAVSLDGEVTLIGSVEGGVLHLEALDAEIGPGTSVGLRLERLGWDADGLKVFDGTAHLDVTLASMTRPFQKPASRLHGEARGVVATGGVLKVAELELTLVENDESDEGEG